MLTNDQINSIAQAVAVAVAHTLSNLLGQKAAVQPKASPQTSKRHAAIIAGFKRRGIAYPKLFTDIKSYQAWLAAGRQVKRNAKSVSGLFHVTDTDAIAA